jgi:hypothetical protein
MTSPINPTKYLGPNQYLGVVVIRNRQPTNADVFQPETGKYYLIGTVWQVGKDPTTGTQGQLYMLSKIVSNLGYWVLISSGGISLETFVTNIAGPVSPDGSGEVFVNASTSTFTDGSVANTLKTEVQATDHEVLIGNGTNVPIGTITNGAAGTVLTSNGVGFDPTFQVLPALGSFNQINIRKFDDTMTPTAYAETTGTKYVIVEVQGGGGGSGGVGATGANEIAVSGGGAGGGYARKFLTVAQATGQIMTIGAGGTAGTNAPTDGGPGGETSFGALCVATGGSGNASQTAEASAFMLKGGDCNGGIGTAGDILIPGGPGGVGIGSGTTSNEGGGQGGSSYFGAGGAISTATGKPGRNYGGGASGATSVNGSGAEAGAAGAQGVIYVTEFISV